MRSITVTRSAGVALAAAAALALSACGGSDDSPSPGTGGSPSTTTSSSTSEAAPSSEAPTSEAPSSEAPTSDAEPSSEAPTSAAPTSDAAGGNDTGDKPSKQDVSSGLKKFYSTQNVAGMEVLDMDKFSDCMVDKGYNTWSNKTLDAIAKGTNMGIDPKDASTFAKFGSECGPQSLKAGGAGSAPTS